MDMDRHRPGLVVDERGHVAAAVAPRLDGRNAERARGQRRQHGPDAEPAGFAPDEDTYTASVASTVAKVTVTPPTTDDGATIEYLNASNMTLADVGTDAGG